MKKKAPAQPNQSLIDGIRCLQALTTEGTAVGVTDLARRLRMEPTRVNRLLKTLSHIGMAIQDSKRRYLPGAGLSVLAAQSLYSTAVLRASRETLRWLLEQVDMVVALGVLWEDKVSYLYHGNPGNQFETGIGAHPSFEATTSGLGIAMLAEHTAEEIREVYASRDIPFFEEGVNSLLATCREVRARGYALYPTRTNPGVETLARTIPGRLDMAIGVAGVFDPPKVKRVLTLLNEAVTRISDEFSKIENPETESGWI